MQYSEIHKKHKVKATVFHKSQAATDTKVNQINNSILTKDNKNSYS